MDVTPEQHKLLASAIRMRILHALNGEPMTSKQVADRLGETPGNIHYHIQRLYDGALLELVETRETGGILEKYYKAVGTRFHIDEQVSIPPGKRLNVVGTRLSLTEVELKELSDQVIELLEQWELRTLSGNNASRQEIAVEFNVYRPESEEDTDGKQTERG